MPNNITDVLTFTTPIVAPADGDAETGASVQTGMQGLANRTALANSVLNSTGITLIRSGSAAAMAALSMTAGNDGQVFHRNGWGLYRYTNPSALPVDSIWVYTAAGAASGQWVYESYSNLNQGVGLATVGPYAGNGTPSGRIAQSVVPYGVVGTPSYGSYAPFTTSSTSAVALTGSPTINLGSLNVGDIVELVAPSFYTCNSVCSFGAMYNENGGGYTSVTLANYAATASGAVNAAGVLSHVRVVGVAGPYLMQFWGSAVSATLTVFASPIFARVYRP